MKTRRELLGAIPALAALPLIPAVFIKDGKQVEDPGVKVTDVEGQYVIIINGNMLHPDEIVHSLPRVVGWCHFVYPETGETIDDAIRIYKIEQDRKTMT